MHSARGPVPLKSYGVVLQYAITYDYAALLLTKKELTGKWRFCNTEPQLT